jgi:hypothetical protein
MQRGAAEEDTTMGTVEIETATEVQLAAIAARAVDDVARAIARDGLVLTWEQAEEIGDAGGQWLRDRLGLRATTSDRGVTYRPATEQGEVQS